MARHEGASLRSTGTIERFYAQEPPRDDRERQIVRDLLEVLGQLRAAQASDDTKGSAPLVFEWLQQLHAVLIDRLNRWIKAQGDAITPRAEGAGGKGKHPGKNLSVQSFESHVKVVRGTAEKPKRASLVDISHWFYGEQPLEPAALREGARTAMGLPPDPLLLAELYVFGSVRNVLAHRTEYESGIAAPEIPEAFARYVSLAGGRVVVSRALVSVLDAFTSRLFAGASNSVEPPPAAAQMEQLAQTLYRISASRLVGPQADASPARRAPPGTSKRPSAAAVAAVCAAGGLCLAGAWALRHAWEGAAAVGPSASASTRTAPAPRRPTAATPVFDAPERLFEHWRRASLAKDADALGVLYVRERGGFVWHSTPAIDTVEAVTATLREQFANGAVTEALTDVPSVSYAPASGLPPGSACRRGGDPAERVARIVFPVRWFRSATSRFVPCQDLRGPYVLRARREEGSWRICSEGLDFCATICASCPQAPDCARRCPPGR